MPLITSRSTPVPSTLPSLSANLDEHFRSPRRPEFRELFDDTFTRVATAPANRAEQPTILQEQQRTLAALAEYMRRDAFEERSHLRGFSHAYFNTIQSHINQLEKGEFSDPTVTNHFAIDFANRYKSNLEALKAQARGDTSATVEPHWSHAWNRAEQLSFLPFVPEALNKSAQILLGKTAHIDYDLKPSLSSALRYKSEREGTATARSLEPDFLKAGAHFDETTERTSSELGLPWALASVGSFVSDVPEHRRTRFEEWVRSEEPASNSEIIIPSFSELGW